MNLRKNTISGAKWSLVQNLGSQVLSLAVFIILARMLDPTEFGLFALAYVYANFVSIMVTSGFETALIQREDLQDEHIHTAFWVNILLGLLLTGISFLLSEPVASLFDAPKLADVINLISIIFIINSPIAVQRALLRRNFKFKQLSSSILIANFLSSLVAALMAFQGYGVWSLVGREIVSSLILTLMLWQAIAWRPKFILSITHLKELYGFSLNIMGNNMFRFMIRRADNLLIGYFLGATTLGFYTIAYRILDLMIQISTRTIVSVATPALSRLQNDLKKFAEATGKVDVFILLICLPTFLGIAVLAPAIIPLLFGEKWEQSVPIMQILAFIGIAQSNTHLLSTALVALGDPGSQLKLRAIEGLCTLGALLLVVQQGVIFAACAVTSVNILMMPVWYLTLKRRLAPEKLDIGQSLLKILASCSLMVLSLVILQRYTLALNEWLALTLLVSCGVAVYLFAIAVLLPDSIQLILSLIRSNKQSGNPKN